MLYLFIRPRIRKIASKADLKNAKLKKILFLFISQTENDNSTLKVKFSIFCKMNLNSEFKSL